MTIGSRKEIQSNTESTFVLPTSHSNKLSDLEIQGSLKLAKILERIHNRLIQEGYTVKNGIIIKKENE